ncbi:decapping and exoribonuclease protein [Girardinichthys multiradiatus]|uniref:decapping and exoribonuclease protein n=1 Tax=Girardinichthys multiradiatus TaxID=208333 RepID=UPI001FACD2C9|nr:decapping and exoribonuclease protein [Girardinichthys multiradiatus]XP_047213351.1 decapping and exoribonuclease protein [Girardinichthys multiradiatus]XP_047213352.1 decapping and exoribonuclease protein [Girardinichthys multiradiatus]XP_047213353.1 decapping and exoribonuclease protein [Girardinichthys multiradiatus]XP_047213354.1 decapping and exoribonuclease protein [Girardinichthys multiradiatus]XP_047213355.1 decapping and exoribonuclease protein [Girardinichthys multiradiatus]XP_04
MDRHRSRSPVTSSQHHYSPNKRGDNRRAKHCDAAHFRPTNHHWHQSSATPEQTPPRSQTLCTRREAYERAFPLYKQPVEVGCFSLDSQRRFFNDSRQMRYYVEPDRSPNFDLSDGYRGRYVKRDENVKEKLDHILRWIVANRSKLKSKLSPDASCLLDFDFVTWRGHLTKLLTTPYETSEGWLLAVTRFNGTLYISEVETEAAHRERENRPERNQEMMYWGYKFEQYMCADKTYSEPDPSGVVNTNEAFCTVVQTRLTDHKLLFSGEVDCRDKDPDAPPPPACYVELKTSAEICTPKQRSNFHRFKLLKWWAQSFLPGVPRVVAGFRDHDGIVVSVETFQISKISQLIKNEYNCWKPTVCMNFCCDFLSFVKHEATEDNPSVVYLFSWEPHKDVTYSVHRDSQYSFLPDWYIKEMTCSGE